MHSNHDIAEAIEMKWGGPFMMGSCTVHLVSASWPYLSGGGGGGQGAGGGGEAWLVVHGGMQLEAGSLHVLFASRRSLGSAPRAGGGG